MFNGIIMKVIDLLSRLTNYMERALSSTNRATTTKSNLIWKKPKINVRTVFLQALAAQAEHGAQKKIK